MAKVINPKLLFPTGADTVQRTRHDPRIIYQNIELPPCRDIVIGKLFHTRNIAKIHARDLNITFNFAKLAGGCIGAPRWDCNFRPRTSERSHSLYPDAGITARYDDIFARQIHARDNL